MKNVGWDFYQVFIAVARNGGLTGAAQAEGSSPATIGRRILELEQSLGRQLFVRSQAGYRLTADGAVLLEQLKEMESVARGVDAWRRHGEGQSVVRLMLGTWVARLACENIAAIRTEADDFRLDMSVSEQRATLAHRESDVGVRAFAPEESYLASRLVGDVAYASYRRSNAIDPRLPWLAVSPSDAVSPYLRWPHEQVASQIAIIASRPRSLLDLVRAGAGQAVLPCFVGDLDPGLERSGEEIRPLRHRQWIVTNSEDRHRRDIRTVSERLFRLLRGHGDLFSGKRPSRRM